MWLHQAAGTGSKQPHRPVPNAPFYHRTLHVTRCSGRNDGGNDAWWRTKLRPYQWQAALLVLWMTIPIGLSVSQDRLGAGYIAEDVIQHEVALFLNRQEERLHKAPPWLALQAIIDSHIVDLEVMGNRGPCSIHWTLYGDRLLITCTAP